MSTQPLYEWIRVLRYVGTREALDVEMENRQVKGVSPGPWQGGALRIYEGYVGETPTRVNTRPVYDLVKAKIEDAGERHFDSGAERQAYIQALQDILEKLPL